LVEYARLLLKKSRWFNF